MFAVAPPGGPTYTAASGGRLPSTTPAGSLSNVQAAVAAGFEGAELECETAV